MTRSVLTENIEFCYIARGTPIRDRLICGHVALDKCNVSRRATGKQLLPAPKQNLRVYNCFSSLFKDYKI